MPPPSRPVSPGFSAKLADTSEAYVSADAPRQHAQFRRFPCGTRAGRRATRHRRSARHHGHQMQFFPKRGGRSAHDTRCMRQTPGVRVDWSIHFILIRIGNAETARSASPDQPVRFAAFRAKLRVRWQANTMIPGPGTRFDRGSCTSMFVRPSARHVSSNAFRSFPHYQDAGMTGAANLRRWWSPSPCRHLVRSHLNMMSTLIFVAIA